MKEEKEERKLTLKQRAWLKAYFETFNATEAARRAGYKCRNEEHLRNIGAQNYTKLCREIEKWIDEHGFSDAHLKQKILEGMKAMETKFFAHEGHVVETKEVIPWEVRRKYLDMAIKVKGLYAPEKRELTGKGGEPIRFINFPEKPLNLKECQKEIQENPQEINETCQNQKESP